MIRIAWFFIFPGSNIQCFSLLNVKVPKVHPNIIGPGLAQFPVLDISGTDMADSQRGTLFFSILDTKKVKILTLERSDLTRVNFVILATAVSSVQRANLSQVIIFNKYTEHFLSISTGQSWTRSGDRDLEKMFGFQDSEILTAWQYPGASTAEN